MINVYNLAAQESAVFSGETLKFPDELFFFMQKNINTESEKVLNEFIAAWKTDSLFNPGEQKRIIELSAGLLEKNAKPFPHFMHYLKCLVLMKSTGQKLKISSTGKRSGAFAGKPQSDLANHRSLPSFTRHLIDSSSLYRPVVLTGDLSRDYNIAVILPSDYHQN
jgi:hypothetical protein